jgi:hypothetical protein
MLPTKFRLFAPAVSEKIFKKSINQKQELPIWQPCFLTDRDEMSNLYRGHSIDASYQVLVHWTKRFETRFLDIDQSETIIAYGSHVC